MDPVAILLGVLLGVALAAPVSWLLARRLVERTREAERRARDSQRLAEIGAMTGGLAHEIKNPLSTIGLNAQLLAEAIDDIDAPEDTKGRLTRRIGALRREAERLRDILQDFLQFAGAVRLDRSPGDVNRAVDELTDFFMPQAELAGVRLRTELAPGPLLASLDTPHFKQALLNLLINATQAMEAGGDRAAQSNGVARELILRTSRRRGQGGAQIAVQVIDTGPGVDPEKLPRIFEPYFSTKSGGSGLGLPTTRRLIEEHGGEVRVNSEPGRGTEFTILLPALEESGAARTAEVVAAK